jgi:hypothetical protein
MFRNDPSDWPSSIRFPHSFSGARASVTRFLGSTIYLGQQAIPFLLDRIGQDF